MTKSKAAKARGRQQAINLQRAQQQPQQPIDHQAYDIDGFLWDVEKRGYHPPFGLDVKDFLRHIRPFHLPNDSNPRRTMKNILYAFRILNFYEDFPDDIYLRCSGEDGPLPAAIFTNVVDIIQTARRGYRDCVVATGSAPGIVPPNASRLTKTMLQVVDRSLDRKPVSSGTMSEGDIKRIRDLYKKMATEDLTRLVLTGPDDFYKKDDDHSPASQTNAARSAVGTSRTNPHQPQQDPRQFGGQQHPRGLHQEPEIDPPENKDRLPCQLFGVRFADDVSYDAPWASYLNGPSRWSNGMTHEPEAPQPTSFLRAVQAFNRPDDENDIRVNRDIVQRNATTIFQAAMFYHPFSDTDVYWEYLAEDLRMDVETCKQIVKLYVEARKKWEDSHVDQNDVVHQGHNPFAPNDLLRAIDKYVAMPKKRPDLQMTAARERYIEAHREVLRDRVKGIPGLLYIGVSTVVPLPENVDWIPARPQQREPRRRSASPLARRPDGPAGVRERSPLRPAKENLPPAKETASPAVESGKQKDKAEDVAEGPAQQPPAEPVVEDDGMGEGPGNEEATPTSPASDGSDMFVDGQWPGEQTSEMEVGPEDVEAGPEPELEHPAVTDAGDVPGPEPRPEPEEGHTIATGEGETTHPLQCCETY